MSIFDEDQQEKPSRNPPETAKQLAKEAISLRNSLFGQDTRGYPNPEEDDHRQEPVMGNPGSFEDDEYETDYQNSDQIDTSEPEYDYQDESDELPPILENEPEPEPELNDELTSEHETDFEAETETTPQVQEALDVEPPQLQMQQTFTAIQEPQRQATSHMEPIGRDRSLHDEDPEYQNFTDRGRFSVDGVFNPGMRALLNWGVLAVLIIVAIWNLTWQSEANIKLNALSGHLDQLDRQMPQITDGANLQGNDQLANLDARIDELEKQLERAAEQTALKARLDALENNLQITTRQVEQAAKKQAAAPPVLSSGGWFINIAVLSDKKNATNLRDKVKNLGADGRMESYPSQGRTLYRVRAYGYPSKSAASNDVQRLQTALNLKGFWVGEK